MRTFEIGEKLHFIVDEFDGHCVIPCEVTEKHEDHYIAKELYVENPETLWIDEDTEYLFERV